MDWRMFVFNGFWLILPLLLWNIIVGSRITQEKITSDAHSPAWLLGAENIFRLATFILPLFLTMKFNSITGKTGLVIYIIGTLIYFASWLPLILAPQSPYSESMLGLFAPRLTPLISLLGIALICNSWPYGLIAAIFIFFHTWHGIQNL
jgi:Na+-translocating ferredoxin:NAD+ oxidoreductase RnfA subunit